jgi:DegV family protein with EDD domain
MGRVVVVTDSTCDLSKKLIEENDIKVLPLYVSFDEDIYKDGEEITSEKLYELVKENKKLPKTSACSVGDFMNFFKQYLDEGYEVFYTGIGGKLSSTYANALLAKEELDTDKIQVSDSGNLSSGVGLLALKAAKFAKEGKNALEIKREIDVLVPKVRSKFVVESLEYLHKGGRCSGVARFFGTMARLKPVIVVENGKLDVLAKPIGKKKGLNIMLDDTIANKDNIHNDCVMVTHTYADEDASYLKDSLNTNVPNAHVEETTAGCVISSHCGKGTIGILYILK